MRRFGALVGIVLVVGCGAPLGDDRADSTSNLDANENKSTAEVGRCNANFTPLDGDLEECALAGIAPRVGTVDGVGSAVVISAGRESDRVILLSAAHVRMTYDDGLSAEEEMPLDPEEEMPLDPEDPESAGGAMAARAADLGPSKAGELVLLDESGSEGTKKLALRNVFDPGGSFVQPRNDLWFVETTSASARAAAKGFRAVKAGERVRILGVVVGGMGPRLTACTVLDDDQAREAITRLAREKDDEGSIPYDPEVEAICEGRAFSGMSGGGVFGDDGKVVGTTIRAAQGKRPIIRFVRASFAVSRLRAAVQQAPAEERTRLEELLPDELVDGPR